MLECTEILDFRQNSTNVDFGGQLRIREIREKPLKKREKNVFGSIFFQIFDFLPSFDPITNKKI